LGPVANPTIAGYNTSVVKGYNASIAKVSNAMSSLVCVENKNIGINF
jgi:hypothetical protein